MQTQTASSRLELRCTRCGGLATVAHVPAVPLHLQPMVGVAMRMLAGDVTLNPGQLDPAQISAVLELECARCAAYFLGDPDGPPAAIVNLGPINGQ